MNYTRIDAKARIDVKAALAAIKAGAGKDEYIRSLLTILSLQGNQINDLKAQVKKQSAQIAALESTCKSMFETITRVEKSARQKTAVTTKVELADGVTVS